MSDDWQVPDDLADRVRRLDRTDAWAREIERTAEVRAILTDLIAELRDEHRMDNGGYCEACDVEPFPCASGRAVNWAEARLREVTGDASV